MVHCIEVQYISVPAVQCKSLQALLQLAAQKLSKSTADLKLHFVDAAQRTTLMESDTDLLSLKYVTKEKNYKFKVEVCKSKEQIENEMRSEAIEEYLSSTYEGIIDAEVERELKRISQEYLQELYAEVAR
jgi:ssRNA-specific RNase YbeY (16S rRNA maturation enzyme)